MLRRRLKLTAITLASLVLLLIAIKYVSDARYFSNYDSDLPLKVVDNGAADIRGPIDLFGVERERAFRKTSFSIEARPGDRVPCLLTQPSQFEGKLPVIVFVHGLALTKEFVEKICTPFNEAGFAMVCYDQWNSGERAINADALTELASWYDRGWKACNDARRIADYLITRDDVDPERLYLMGVSYGAMVGTHVLAHDKRFKAGVLTVGGGNFKVMLDAPLIRREVPGAVLAMLKPVANWFSRCFDPISSAAMTGPMPILMQCGTADSLVTPESGKALFAALAAPKEITWYDMDPHGLREGEGHHVVTLLDDALKWLSSRANLPAPKTNASEAAGTALSLAREQHWLIIRGAHIPGGEIRINYLEAYCRAGSTDADWVQHTVIGHTSEVLSADGKAVHLRDTLADGVTVAHTITAQDGAIDFQLTAHNPAATRSEAHWAQPCVRLAAFTGFDPQGKDIDDYLPNCFVFLDGELSRMPTRDWATTARYTPGQVWRPRGVPRTDVNPRPLNPLAPSNGLIGAFSGDETMIFATAWEPYQELFQGVARCVHSDFRLGGLDPGETKHIHGKIYIVPNEVPALLARYKKDFPEHAR